jgi:hypothetical protein
MGGRCHTIRQKIVREFRRAVAHLKRDGSVESLLSEAEVGEWRIVPLIRNVAGLCRDQPAATLGTFTAVKEQYEGLCGLRYKSLENREVLVLHTRTEPYSEIWNRFSAVIGDYDDCEMILDAHDVAVKIDGMILYSGDYRHVIANRDLILLETSLHDVRYLADHTGSRSAV